MKNEKHNSHYFAWKLYLYIFLGHYLFLDAHFFSFHQFIWVLDFCPWTSLKENVDIDIKYLLLIINNKSKTKTLKKFISYFQFPIPFSHSTFPICISHSTFSIPRFSFPIPAFSNIRSILEENRDSSWACSRVKNSNVR